MVYICRSMNAGRLFCMVFIVTYKLGSHGSHGSEHRGIAIGPSGRNGRLCFLQIFLLISKSCLTKETSLGEISFWAFLASNLHPIYRENMERSEIRLRKDRQKTRRNTPLCVCVCSLFTKDQVGIPNQNTHTHTFLRYPNINEQKFIAKYMDSLPSPKPTSASRLRRRLESLLFCFKSGFFLQDPCETLLSWLMTPPVERYQADWLKCNVDLEGQRGYNNEENDTFYELSTYISTIVCVW